MVAKEQPCTVNLDNEWEIVQHFRDLYNLAPLLARGLNEEELLFIQKLKEYGYGDNRIHDFITRAGYGTRYEKLEDSHGDRIVPPNIPERGDQKEWFRNKFRVAK